MTEKNITYHSSKIFYRITGKGFPVVLLHGFGEDGDIWEHQVNYLQDHFQLIIPDLPGSGKSEELDLQQSTALENYAEVVRKILSEENIDQCIIIGHSMGGYISLAFVEKYSDMLSAFGLFHSSAFADNEEKKQARAKSNEFIKANGAYEFLKTAIPGLFLGQDGSLPSDPYINTLVEKGRSFSSQALISYYQAMINRPDRTTVLRSFPHPVLFVLGEHDKAVPFQQGLQQCYLPVQSHVHILRNSAHMGMVEESSKSSDILLHFLQSATS